MQPSDGGSALASVLLPSVVRDASAAVLLVDLRLRNVTFANPLAEQLAPNVRLPVSVDEWSRCARLADAAGTKLPDFPNDAGQHAESNADPDNGPHAARVPDSLLRIARGEPVAGEAVTAEFATGETESREPLWVLGLPLDGAPDELSHFALVVFLPARNARAIAGVQESAANLRDRAVLATRVAFTITDPHAVDGPLIWVNPAFTTMTGYTFEDSVGRNCRFLQGPDTDPQIVADIGRALRAEQPMTTTLLNYRKDGTSFWNELSISPVRDQRGSVTHFVGVQADVTTRVEAQHARDDALARAAAAADRLALLADFTSQMALCQHPQQVVDLIADVLVPRVCTWALVYTRDELGQVRVATARHELIGLDADTSRLLGELTSVAPSQLQPNSPVLRVLDGRDPFVLLPDYDAASRAESGAADDARTALVRRIGVHSVVVAPLLARGGVVGCVALITDGSRPALGEADLALARDISLRGGLMLENTQLYARERAAASTLQRSLLPRLPRLDGVIVAAAYVPAADEVAVGGDWYDVFATRDRGVGVVVGDVMGHNMDSAAGMGKLSTLVRAYAWPGSAPRDVFTAVDDFLAASELTILATCVYAKLQDGRLRYASAGHPPAFVRWPDGRTTLVDGSRGPMLGVSTLLTTDRTRAADADILLPRGATLICFTDGLADAHSDEPDIEHGLTELCRLTEALPLDAAPQLIVDALTTTARRHSDDVAVVAIRVA